MIVAITGGTGLIGRRLVARHLQRGDRVRILSRRSAADVSLPPEVEVCQGDLAAEQAELAAFVRGADLLYHSAGELREPDRMRAVHVEGTRRLVAAARGEVRRWVQVSSVGAYGRRREGVVTEETPEHPHGLYEVTKLEADRIVAGAATEGSFECVVLRPSIVYAGDMRQGSLFQMVSMIDRRLFFFVGPRGASANYVHADNVAEALVLCAVLPQARGVYNLSDDRTLEEFVGQIAAALGKEPPGWRLPEAVVRRFASMLGRIPGFPLTESRVDALVGRSLYPSEKIRRELGYVPVVSMEEGIEELVGAWRAAR